MHTAHAGDLSWVKNIPSFRNELPPVSGICRRAMQMHFCFQSGVLPVLLLKKKMLSLVLRCFGFGLTAADGMIAPAHSTFWPFTQTSWTSPRGEGRDPWWECCKLGVDSALLLANVQSQEKGINEVAQGLRLGWAMKARDCWVHIITGARLQPQYPRSSCRIRLVELSLMSLEADGEADCYFITI